MLKAIVLKAADLIEEGGLSKGWFSDGTKRCLLGALADAADAEYPKRYPQDFKVLKAIPAIRWAAGLGVHVGDQEKYVQDLIRWNDADERTKEDVVTCLRKAAGYL